MRSPGVLKSDAINELPSCMRSHHRAGAIQGRGGEYHTCMSLASLYGGFAGV